MAQTLKNIFVQGSLRTVVILGSKGPIERKAILPWHLIKGIRAWESQQVILQEAYQVVIKTPKFKAAQFSNIRCAFGQNIQTFFYITELSL